MKTTTKQSSANSRHHNQQPAFPKEVKIPCGIEGKTIWAWTSTVRHDDATKPFVVTSREQLPIREIAADGKTALLGMLPLSEFKTVPHKNPERAKKNETSRIFFQRYEITLCVPKSVEAFVDQKHFYGKQSMTAIRGRDWGNAVLYSCCIPLIHTGKTAGSGIGTLEDYNNLYLTLRNGATFQTWAVALVWDPKVGMMLVMSKPYEGDVFRATDGQVDCPILSPEAFAGRTGEMLLPTLQDMFKEVKLPVKPEGYTTEAAMNLDCLRRGTLPDTSRWAEAFITMDSVARTMSFGYMKGSGDDKGLAEFVYVDWFQLPAEAEKMRRIPTNTIVRGKLEDAGGGRMRLTNISFLPADEMAAKVAMITDPKVIMEKGSHLVMPEWLAKRTVIAKKETASGLAFAGLFAKAMEDAAAKAAA